MKTYTLALVTPDQAESQIQVGEFPEEGRAIELAELIAAEMGLEAGESRSGWSIEVRDPKGSRLYTVPVGPSAAHAQPHRTAVAAL